MVTSWCGVWNPEVPWPDVRRWTLALLLIAGCRGCDGCGADLPDTSDTDDTEDTDTDTDTEAARCEVPEAEPNDAFAQATPIALEEEGCGDISRPFDLDNWTFTTDMPMWLGVYVEAAGVGSFADVAVVLDDGEGGVTEARDSQASEDVALVIPVEAGTWNLLVTDQQTLGGEQGYYYDLLVTEDKEPVEWTAEEAESNDDLVDAHVLADEDRVFGTIAPRFDDDWYRVDVPTGPHTVTVWIEAYAWGSPANLVMELYGDAGALQDTVWDGENGWEKDPWASFDSDGDESWTFRLEEQDDRGGSTYWYVLGVDVKGADE